MAFPRLANDKILVAAWVKLEKTKDADVRYEKVMQKSTNIMSEWMASMKLGKWNVKMTDYPTDSENKILHNVLKEYNKTYNWAICLNGGQSRMNYSKESKQNFQIC